MKQDRGKTNATRRGKTNATAVLQWLWRSKILEAIKFQRKGFIFKGQYKAAQMEESYLHM